MYEYTMHYYCICVRLYVWGEMWLNLLACVRQLKAKFAEQCLFVLDFFLFSTWVFLNAVNLSIIHFFFMKYSVCYDSLRLPCLSVCKNFYYVSSSFLKNTLRPILGSVWGLLCRTIFLLRFESVMYIFIILFVYRDSMKTLL